MAAAERLAEDWLHAEREGRRIAVSGRWGTAEGFVASPSRPSGGWLGGGRRATDAECTVLVAPQWPGIEDARACAEVDRALCAALLRAGHAVAHVRSFMPAEATSEMYQWVFIGPLFFAAGAVAALASLELDWGPAVIHYSFYVLVTATLRWLAGLSPV